MVRKTSLIVLSLFVIALASCNKSNVDPDTGKSLVLTPVEEQKVSADNAFTLKLMKNVSGANTTGANLFLSPLSVSFALGMTSNGSSGETLSAIRNTMEFSGFTEDQVNSYYSKMMSELPQLDPKTTISIANSIWYKQDFSVLPQFLQTNSNFYHAKVQALNFSDPSAKAQINNWVSSSTNGKIPTIVDDVPGTAIMYLINAIYFKGSWKTKFDAANTAKAPFNLANGSTVQADFMSKNDLVVKKFVNSEVTVAELPYSNNKFSMVIVMPSGDKSVSSTIANLDSVKWKSWISGLTPSETLVKLPKFKFSYDIKLNAPLIALGMGIAFSSGADLTRINAGGGLFISEVKHKAFVEVNEDGTTAAAVTSVSIGVSAPAPQPPLIFDHPFLFVIRETSSGLILFAGTMNNPLAPSAP